MNGFKISLIDYFSNLNLINLNECTSPDCKILILAGLGIKDMIIEAASVGGMGFTGKDPLSRIYAYGIGSNHKVGMQNLGFRGRVTYRHMCIRMTLILLT